MPFCVSAPYFATGKRIQSPAARSSVGVDQPDPIAVTSVSGAKHKGGDMDVDGLAPAGFGPPSRLRSSEKVCL